MLSRLLHSVARQKTDGHFTFSIVVVDNDAGKSAERVATEFALILPGRFCYLVESRQNIALARNLALAHSQGDYVAFIDDDEFPEADWLCTLLAACDKFGADGVLAPVNPHFENPPPRWLLKGRFFDRPQHPTGHSLAWQFCRTGNALLKRSAFTKNQITFRAEFGSGGEDRDFFRRLIELGHSFVWCEEAAVYEVVPPWRWRRTTFLRRALLRGKMSLNEREGRARQIAVSIVALPLYGAALPFLALGGQHVWMKYLIKLCDHAGRLLAVCGLNPITDVYVTE